MKFTLDWASKFTNKSPRRDKSAAGSEVGKTPTPPPRDVPKCWQDKCRKFNESRPTSSLTRDELTRLKEKLIIGFDLDIENKNYTCCFTENGGKWRNYSLPCLSDPKNVVPSFEIFVSLHRRLPTEDDRWVGWSIWRGDIYFLTDWDTFATRKLRWSLRESRSLRLYKQLDKAYETNKNSRRSRRNSSLCSDVSQESIYSSRRRETPGWADTSGSSLIRVWND